MAPSASPSPVPLDSPPSNYSSPSPGPPDYSSPSPGPPNYVSPSLGPPDYGFPPLERLDPALQVQNEIEAFMQSDAGNSFPVLLYLLGQQLVKLDKGITTYVVSYLIREWHGSYRGSQGANLHPYPQTTCTRDTVPVAHLAHVQSMDTRQVCGLSKCLPAPVPDRICTRYPLISYKRDFISPLVRHLNRSTSASSNSTLAGSEINGPMDILGKRKRVLDDDGSDDDLPGPGGPGYVNWDPDCKRNGSRKHIRGQLVDTLNAPPAIHNAPPAPPAELQDGLEDQDQDQNADEVQDGQPDPSNGNSANPSDMDLSGANTSSASNDATPSDLPEALNWGPNESIPITSGVGRVILTVFQAFEAPFQKRLGQFFVSLKSILASGSSGLTLSSTVLMSITTVQRATSLIENHTTQANVYQFLKVLAEIQLALHLDSEYQGADLDVLTRRTGPEIAQSVNTDVRTFQQWIKNGQRWLVVLCSGNMAFLVVMIVLDLRSKYEHFPQHDVTAICGVLRTAWESND
ncbi:hypothetical protein BDN72DRAFT_906443 [Pluteus cervinus]|uniref:Uncharacterized protein n=1 Tax=Pluteus cervinus TaxID=181527 RepID=A0ACD2ZZI2_9AGAR|nr:hypothetical protein BDN72DRAFT_906443 [Pluteus cervinus]